MVIIHWYKPNHENANTRVKNEDVKYLLDWRWLRRKSKQLIAAHKDLQADTIEMFSLTVGTNEGKATSSDIKQQPTEFRWETTNAF